jgi:hypothetical protein
LNKIKKKSINLKIFSEKTAEALVLPLCTDQPINFNGDCLSNVTPSDDEYIEMYDISELNVQPGGVEDRNALSAGAPCPVGFFRDRRSVCRKSVRSG